MEMAAMHSENPIKHKNVVFFFSINTDRTSKCYVTWRTQQLLTSKKVTSRLIRTMKININKKI